MACAWISDEITFCFFMQLCFKSSQLWSMNDFENFAITVFHTCKKLWPNDRQGLCYVDGFIAEEKCLNFLITKLVDTTELKWGVGIYGSFPNVHRVMKNLVIYAIKRISTKKNPNILFGSRLSGWDFGLSFWTEWDVYFLICLWCSIIKNLCY